MPGGYTNDTTASSGLRLSYRSPVLQLEPHIAQIKAAVAAATQAQKVELRGGSVLADGKPRAGAPLGEPIGRGSRLFYAGRHWLMPNFGDQFGVRHDVHLDLERLAPRTEDDPVDRGDIGIIAADG